MGGAKRRIMAERKIRDLKEALRRQEMITQRLASLAGISAAAVSSSNNRAGNGAAPRRLQHKLFVGNIGDSVTPADLEREFRRFGEINETWVAKNPPGFGFVEFKRRRDAIEACQEMDDKAVFSSKHKIRVEFAKADHKGNSGNSGRNKPRSAQNSNKSGPVQPLMEVKVVPRLLSGLMSSVIGGGRRSPDRRGGRIRPLIEGMTGDRRSNRDNRARRRSPSRDRNRGAG